MCTSVPHTPARRTWISTRRRGSSGCGTSRSTKPGPAVAFTSALTRASLSIWESRSPPRVEASIETKRMRDVRWKCDAEPASRRCTSIMRRARFTIACDFIAFLYSRELHSSLAHRSSRARIASREAEGTAWGHPAGSSSGRRPLPPPRSPDSPRFPPPPAPRFSRRPPAVAASRRRPDLKALAHLALDAARSAGASYADVRISAQPLAVARSRASGASPALDDSETLGLRRARAGRTARGASPPAATDARRGGARGAPGRGAGARQRRDPRAPGGAGARRAPSPNGSWTHADRDRPVQRRRSRRRSALLLAANAAALKAGRALRQLEHVLPARGEDLRQHRRLVHRADDLPRASRR